MLTNKTLRACNKEHKYYKSSACPTCPMCEQERRPQNGFLSLLTAPARRVLENNGITTLQQLSTFREAEILQFHGMGSSLVPKFRKALAEKGLILRNIK